jgi:hypothetical protein
VLLKTKDKDKNLERMQWEKDMLCAKETNLHHSSDVKIM